MQKVVQSLNRENVAGEEWVLVKRLRRWGRKADEPQSQANYKIHLGSQFDLTDYNRHQAVLDATFRTKGDPILTPLNNNEMLFEWEELVPVDQPSGQGKVIQPQLLPGSPVQLQPPSPASTATPPFSPYDDNMYSHPDYIPSTSPSINSTVDAW